MASKRKAQELASEIEAMMKGEFGAVDMGYGNDVVTINPPQKRFQELPPVILKDILLCLINEHDYTVPEVKVPEKMTPAVAKRYKKKLERAKKQHGVKKREMTKCVWRMETVCEKFAQAFNIDKDFDRIPKPTIGLRIMPKPKKTTIVEEEEEPKVLLYVYGDFARKNPAHCVRPNEIADTIYPAVITTQLVVQGFRIDDGTYEMIKALNTSSVEEVYFNDIKAVELENYTIEDLVSLFPNAMEIRFLADHSVASMEEFEIDIPDMERWKYKNLMPGNLVQLYHAVDMESYKRFRSYRNRKVFLRELKNRGVEAEKSEVPHEAIRLVNKRLLDLLNQDPPSPKKTKLTEDETSKLREGMEKLLEEAPNEAVREYLQKML